METTRPILVQSTIASNGLNISCRIVYYIKHGEPPSYVEGEVLYTDGTVENGTLILKKGVVNNGLLIL
jgi:hypothetical protein